MMLRTQKYTCSVLLAGFCWGFMGFFTRNLMRFGIDSTGAIIVRCGTAAICFGLLLLIKDPSAFKIKGKDLWCFLGSGLLSLLFFTFCYFNAINMMSLSAAAILLYTAPTFVMLMSALLFREAITPMKLIAVVLAFVGCTLVSGITGGMQLTLTGLLFGLGSGIGYALYTIFSRYALQKGYSSISINFYSCFLAAAGALIIWGPHGTFQAMVQSPESILWCVGVGVISCFLPYLLYTYGLTGLENSKASVLASVEPVVASLAGIFFYQEKLDFAGIIGVICVLAAVLLLSLKKKD